MSNQPERVRIGIICGGRSAEHEVSLTSTRAVLNSLDPARYLITLIGITRQGSWLKLAEAVEPGKDKLDPAALMAQHSATATLATLPQPELFGLGSATPLEVIFPVLHGTFGEDGTMQGLLEIANLPYIGCGVMASAIGMDKVAARELLQAAGLPVLPFTTIYRSQWEAASDQVKEVIMLKIESDISYPCFVKPVCAGSSVGISKAKNRTELAEGIDIAARFDRKVMIEPGLDRPRELEISVLGNDEPEASVVGELHYTKKAEFYDYKAKYLDDELGFTIPADIAVELSQEMRQLAIQAYRVLDCAGMTRVDFFQDNASGKIYLNEVNTIPGFTPGSMYPKMWEQTGLSYTALLDRLVALALERHADKNRTELIPEEFKQ